MEEENKQKEEKRKIRTKQIIGLILLFLTLLAGYILFSPSKEDGTLILTNHSCNATWTTNLDLLVRGYC